MPPACCRYEQASLSAWITNTPAASAPLANMEFSGDGPSPHNTSLESLDKQTYEFFAQFIHQFIADGSKEQEDARSKRMQGVRGCKE